MVRTSSRRVKRKKSSFPSTHTVTLSRGVTALNSFFPIFPEIFYSHTHTYGTHTMLKLAVSLDKIPSVSFLVTKSMAIPSFETVAWYSMGQLGSLSSTSLLLRDLWAVSNLLALIVLQQTSLSVRIWAHVQMFLEKMVLKVTLRGQKVRALQVAIARHPPEKAVGPLQCD